VKDEAHASPLICEMCWKIQHESAEKIQGNEQIREKRGGIMTQKTYVSKQRIEEKMKERGEMRKEV